MDLGQVRQRSRSPQRRATRHREERAYAEPVFIRVTNDLPPETKELVDIVASFVARGGMQLEQDIARLQSGNPNFNFINAPVSDPANAYYRWKLYSILQNDGNNRWRTEAFQIMSDGNRWWIPPPLPRPTSQVKNTQLYELMTQHGLNAEPLPPQQREEWFRILSALVSPDRDAICNAMVFALDHSVHAFDLMDSLVDAIGFNRNVKTAVDFVRSASREGRTMATEPETTKLTSITQRIISRCFLLSDMLCNSFSTSHSPLSNPRSIMKAADFVLPRFFEEAMSFIVAVSAERHRGRAPWERLELEADSTLWHVLSWTRELWALWQQKGVVSPHLSQMINTQYPFLLEA